MRNEPFSNWRFTWEENTMFIIIIRVSEFQQNHDEWMRLSNALIPQCPIKMRVFHQNESCLLALSLLHNLSRVDTRCEALWGKPSHLHVSDLWVEALHLTKKTYISLSVLYEVKSKSMENKQGELVMGQNFSISLVKKFLRFFLLEMSWNVK